MADLVLPGDIRVALTHMSAIGLAAILEDAGVTDVRLHWTHALESRAVLTGHQLTWDEAAQVVRAHAQRHAAPGDWTALQFASGGEGGPGLFSPRIKAPETGPEWRRLAAARWAQIDALLVARDDLDLYLIGRLGEPAYWRFDTQAKRRPDEGASRWEMKTRNRGEDFVRDRLRLLAMKVAAREPSAILNGLQGATTVDEAGSNAPESRTATGLTGPGPADNATAWVALWGISQFPVIHRTTRPSRTIGHLAGAKAAARRREPIFYLPVPSAPVRISRLRALILSSALEEVAAASGLGAADVPLAAKAAAGWLSARRVGAVAWFPIGTFGSASAPERRALLGTVTPLAEW